MATAAVLLADGFEEIEAVGIIDVLRRAGVDVLITRVGTAGDAIGSHGIRIGTDVHIDDLTAGSLDAVVLPGGIPGATNLRDSAAVRALVAAHAGARKLTGAICAAPIVLAAAGILDGRRVTCYPSFEDQLGGAQHFPCRVIEDSNIVTGQGPGAVLEFALILAARLTSVDKAKQIRAGMLV